MPLKTSERNAVKAAIQRGTQPAFVRDTLTLQLEARRIVLVGPNGRKTQTGGFYERETAQLLPRALDNAGAPVRQGNSEFLTLAAKRDGSAPGTRERTRSITPRGE